MLFFIFTSFVMLLGFTINEEKQIIYIDPGHGGMDGGAVVNGIKESDLNLAISLVLKEVLESNGYIVLLTREEDIHLSGDKFLKKTDLNNRVSMINNSDCLLYLSIHQNTYTNSIYRGAQCFYNSYNTISCDLANNIQSSIISNLSNTTRTSKAVSGVYIIDQIDKPGVLVECGFMSNEDELNLLLNEEYQYKLANAIYTGVLSYLLFL